MSVKSRIVIIMIMLEFNDWVKYGVCVGFGGL